MKRPADLCLILVTARRVARADFVRGEVRTRSAERPEDASSVESVRAALALGGKAGPTWVLSQDVFTQPVELNPAQVAGLTPEQLGRALSFEVEPFSGISVSESVIGFRGGQGNFTIVEISRSHCDGIQQVVAAAGGKLLGITHPGVAPLDDEALQAWWPAWPEKLQARTVAVITPPAPAPSPRRFFVAGVALEIAALFLVCALGAWSYWQRAHWRERDTQLSELNRRFAETQSQMTRLRAEQSTLEKEQEQRERVLARRGALPALLNSLATSRPEEIVVRGIEADGPSSLVVSGISLDASAIDRLSIMLTQDLTRSGWTARPRQKTGKRNLPSGGPWEFSLTVTHEEAARAGSVQLSQQRSE